MRFWPKSAPDWSRDRTLPVCTERLQAGSGRTAWAGVLVRLRLPAVAAAPAGLGRRLLFFSDLHWEELDAGPAAGLVEAMNSLRPDWLVFGGDLARHPRFVAPALEILRRLEAGRGRLAVPGNWEHRCHESTDWWRQAFASVGFNLLVNDFRLPSVAGDPGFYGLDDVRTGCPDSDCAEPLRGLPLVLGLAHSPAAVAPAAGRFLGHLVLAGHTHGGQIRIPGFGALVTSTPYWKQFEHGLYRRRDGVRMLVSAGLGLAGPGLLHRRVFCPPELVLIEW